MGRLGNRSVIVPAGRFPAWGEGAKLPHGADLVELLREVHGNVTAAAERAGIERESFHRLMKRHAVRAEDFRTKGSRASRFPSRRGVPRSFQGAALSDRLPTAGAGRKVRACITGTGQRVNGDEMSPGVPARCSSRASSSRVCCAPGLGISCVR